MTLKHPYFLFLLLLYIPLIWFWLGTKRSNYASLGMSSLASFKKRYVGGRAFLIPVCRILQMVALGCLIVALARPQKQDYMTNSHIMGTDIVLALDISESMRNGDVRPTRFDAAKATANDFIRSRNQDNIGLVIFSGEALSIMPLTNDLIALQNAVSSIRMGALANGTAIGDGLVSAINRVMNGQAKSKSIILLTDGTNNTGDVQPSIAADIAAEKGIKVYTIGIGRDGKSVVTDPYGMSRTTIETPIDEAALKEIANKTGGKFFRVTDANALANVFEEIDKLEKTRMDVENYQRTDEAFMPWVLTALTCFGFVLVLRFTVLTKIP